MISALWKCAFDQQRRTDITPFRVSLHTLFPRCDNAPRYALMSPKASKSVMYVCSENLERIVYDEALCASISSSLETTPQSMEFPRSNVLQIARRDFRKALQPSRISASSEAKSATTGRSWPETNGVALVGSRMAYDRGPRPRKMSGNLRGWKRQS